MSRNKILAVVLSIALVMGTFMAFTPVSNAAATLAWSDEFNGSSLDTTNWNYDIGGGGWGNNELEYYTNRTNNVNVTGGNLVITAAQESYGGMSYTSGRIKTKGLRQFTYGTIEARIKIPTGQGTWPAFWMLGSNIDSVSWPQCGEIDIGEHVDNNTFNNGTIHWNSGSGQADYGLTSQNLDFAQFHTYDIVWDTNDIKWYVDGQLYCDANIANNINGTGAFHLPFFIILNLAVGGNWPGNPNGSVTFPIQMLVDYVRVYNGDAVTGGGATPTPAPTPTATPTPSGTATPTPATTATPTPAATPTPTPGGAQAWAPNTAYSVNQLCTYGGSTYKCLQAHTSIVGWEPPNVPALWQLQ